MKKVGYANVSNIKIDEIMDIGVYEIGYTEYVILGGEFTASGVRNYLRPYDKVVENLNNLSEYANSKKDVRFYMDNKTVSKLNSDVANLRYDRERQRW